MKVKYYIFVIICFMLAVFKIDIVPNLIYQLFKIFVMGLMAIYIINYREKKQNINLNKWCCIYIIYIFVTSFINYRFTNKVFISLVYVILMMELLLFINQSKIKNRMINIIECIYKFFLVFAIFNDILMILFNDSTIEMFKEGYLLGNKFNVTYIHMLLVCFAWQYYVYKRKSYSFILLLMYYILSFMIAVNVKCTTAIIGNIILAILIILPHKVRNILSSSKVMLVSCCGIHILLMVSYLIVLNNPTIKYIIIDILGKDLSLTGRLHIYSWLKDIFLTQPIFGRGYANDAVNVIVGYGNAQNSFLDILINYGIIGTSLFLLAWNNVVKLNESINWPLLALLYVFTGMGIVEITFETYFLFVLFVLTGFSRENDGKK